ncbi:MAG TPA: cryptochrome/photolyase family protein [Bryobacteraceae bacterium]|nr:cryptochrome/photolyase family protein [Bryobacteraceae bacterium]
MRFNCDSEERFFDAQACRAHQTFAASAGMRNLILVLGDQLDEHSSAFDGFDRTADAIWMAEVEEELVHVWCHKLRIAFFLSAMRHFRDRLRARGLRLEYHELSENIDRDAGRDFQQVLTKNVGRLRPERLIVVEPGDYRVKSALLDAAHSLGVPLDIRTDRHFYCSTDEFAQYAAGKSKLVLENFYRYMRRKHKILLEKSGRPTGGSWNYDKQNRERLKAPLLERIEPRSFPPDEITRSVLELVGRRFADHPGSLDRFELPVTREDALRMLDSFISDALDAFGPLQDAMAIDQPFLFHSRLSALLNVKLLNPRECVFAALAAYERKEAALNSVEGYVRQILGWREFVRGIYWHHMPEYAELNFFDHHQRVPEFFWTGDTDMRCMREVLTSVVANGYAHHIQRLMVVGLFSLLYGIHPRLFHEWHMAMYLDAIDWVSLPNALGMSQFADGGIIGTKPYCASGHYIDRMSNYCSACRYDPKLATGARACPFTTLYYDFLDRHFDRLKANSRLKFQLLNIEQKRKDANTLDQIRERVCELLGRWDT